MKVFGIVKPDGILACKTSFFTNRPAAAKFAISEYTGYNEIRKGKDGSDLDWKKMRRQGWKIAPIEFVVQ